MSSHYLSRYLLPDLKKNYKSDSSVFRTRGQIQARAKPFLLSLRTPATSATLFSLLHPWAHTATIILRCLSKEFSKPLTLLSTQSTSAAFSFPFNHTAPWVHPVLWVTFALSTVNHITGRRPLAGRSMSVGDSLVTTASSSHWHSSLASCKSGRLSSESNQLTHNAKSDGGTLISPRLVTTSITGRLLRLESQQGLWFSTTR